MSDIVKPLEWTDQTFLHHAEQAKVSFGSYWAQWDDEVKAWFGALEISDLDGPIILSPSDVPTLDEAKAAAQADYEARIMSALQPVYTRAQVEAMVAEERERCAKIADKFHQEAVKWAEKTRWVKGPVTETDSSRIAAAIRAQGEADR